MKRKAMVLFLVGAMVMSAAGCSQKEKSDTSVSVSADSSSSAEDGETVPETEKANSEEEAIAQ